MEDSIIRKEDEALEFEEKLRPQLLDEYIGQKDVKENLKVFIEAAKMRNESLSIL